MKGLACAIKHGGDFSCHSGVPIRLDSLLLLVAQHVDVHGKYRAFEVRARAAIAVLATTLSSQMFSPGGADFRVDVTAIKTPAFKTALQRAIKDHDTVDDHNATGGGSDDDDDSDNDGDSRGTPRAGGHATAHRNPEQ